MSTLLPASSQNPSFFSVSEQKVSTNHYVVAWLADDKGSAVEPVLYPSVPKGNVLLCEAGMSAIIHPKTGEKFGSLDGYFASLVRK